MKHNEAMQHNDYEDRIWRLVSQRPELRFNKASGVTDVILKTAGQSALDKPLERLNAATVFCTNTSLL